MLIEVDFRLPSVFVEGEYKAQGKIVGFPLGGKGVYNISMSKASIARSAGSVVVAVLQELHVCTARVTVNINTAGAAKEDHDRQTDRQTWPCHRPLTAEPRVRTQANRCGIYGRQTSTVTDFSSTTLLPPASTIPPPIHTYSSVTDDTYIRTAQCH